MRELAYRASADSYEMLLRLYCRTRTSDTDKLGPLYPTPLPENVDGKNASAAHKSREGNTPRAPDGCELKNAWQEPEFLKAVPKSRSPSPPPLPYK